MLSFIAYGFWLLVIGLWLGSIRGSTVVGTVVEPWLEPLFNHGSKSLFLDLDRAEAFPLIACFSRNASASFQQATPKAWPDSLD
jgi:hypothetical protein